MGIARGYMERLKNFGLAGGECQGDLCETWGCETGHNSYIAVGWVEPTMKYCFNHVTVELPDRKYEV